MNLRTARIARRMTLAELAALVGSDPTNLSRIERGVQRPSKELGRLLYEVFEGEVEHGAIYDPEYYDPGYEGAATVHVASE